MSDESMLRLPEVVSGTFGRSPEKTQSLPGGQTKLLGADMPTSPSATPVSISSRLGATIPPDVFIYLCTFFYDIRDFIKFWVAFGLYKVYESNHGVIWREILKIHLFQQKNMTESAVEETILRTGCRLDTQPFLLIRELYKTKKCSRSGCYQPFREIDNFEISCVYHPGKMSNRKHLSCCRGQSFKDPGCKVSFHDGSLFTAILKEREKGDEEGGALLEEGHAAVVGERVTRHHEIDRLMRILRNYKTNPSRSGAIRILADVIAVTTSSAGAGDKI